MKKRMLAILLASTMVLSLAACGGKNDAPASSGGEASESSAAAAEEAPEEVAAEEVSGDDFFGKSTDFTYMVANGITTTDFDKYQDAPAMKYVLAKEWDPDGNGNTRKISLDILVPPAGAESDYANTLISTGDYPDVMNIQIASMSAAEMYEDGMIIDITDYVMQYMPNYLAYFERHPELKDRATTIVDGERRYINLYHLDEQMGNAWGGMLYRRDWIVKYGTNPETGEAFSGSWDDDGNYTDDVVFPSGEAFPKYVSDWEWMLEIFQKALDEQGITDGYAFNVASSGENGAGGDMESGFGSAATWYIDPETGKCVNGTTSDGFRAYIEMMNNWYQKGWVNPTFEEHAGEMFFMTDMGTVYGGKVGAWYGLTSQMGAALDTSGGDESNPTCGAVVFGAPTPINDVYGDESVQGFEPFLYYATGVFGAQLVFTDKVVDKDLPALFTFLDYFYGDEGSVIKAYGLTKDQVEELKGIDEEAYKLYTEKWGLTNGAVEIKEDGMVWRDPIIINDSEIGGACSILRFNGRTPNDREMNDWKPYYAEQMGMFRMYDTTKAGIGGEVTAQLTPEESSNFQDVYNNTSTYMNQAVPQFITGVRDIHDDADWQDFCDTIEGYDVQSYCDAINRVLGVE